MPPADAASPRQPGPQRAAPGGTGDNARARPRLLGLDLDGTLVDSAPDLSDALGAALESLGLPRPTEAETRRWVGDGIEALIERALTHAAGAPPAADAQAAALSAFDAHYRRHYFRRSRVYRGVIPALETLRGAGFGCVCITNKRTAFARPVLEAAGISPYLDDVIGGDSCPRKKPFPDQLLAAAERFGVSDHEAVMVGDSPNDMDAARGAGWRFVFAAYGYTAGMANRHVGPAARIDGFPDLVPLLCGHAVR